MLCETRHPDGRGNVQMPDEGDAARCPCPALSVIQSCSRLPARLSMRLPLCNLPSLPTVTVTKGLLRVPSVPVAVLGIILGVVLRIPRPCRSNGPVRGSGRGVATSICRRVCDRVDEWQTVLVTLRAQQERPHVSAQGNGSASHRLDVRL